jgi:hypothetical protein
MAAEAAAGAAAGAAVGAAVGATAEAAAGTAARARWLTKAVAYNTRDHRGSQHKQQRARQWVLIVYLRRQERRRHLGQPRNYGPAAEALLDGAEYDAETEDAAGCSDAAAAAGMRQPKPSHWGSISSNQQKNWYRWEGKW